MQEHHLNLHIYNTRGTKKVHENEINFDVLFIALKGSHRHRPIIYGHLFNLLDFLCHSLMAKTLSFK